MLVKNTLTGEKIERDDAVIVYFNSKKCFFSSEDEHQQYIKEKRAIKDLRSNYISTFGEIIHLEADPKIFPIMSKHINFLKKHYDILYLEDMLRTIQPTFRSISNQKKSDFFSLESKYNYFYVVLKNQLSKHYESFKARQINLKIIESKTSIQENAFSKLQNTNPNERVNIEKWLEGDEE